MFRPHLAWAMVVILAACARQAPAPPPHSGSDVLLRPETETFDALVPRHATLESLLREHDLADDLVDAAVEAAKAVFNLRQLRADRRYRLVRSADGMLREFEYQIDGNRFLRILNSDRTRPDALDAEVLSYEGDARVVAIEGHIDADHPSVIAAMDETGERVQLAMALADIFSGQIDFENDLQQGDTFQVLFERYTHEGQFAGYGGILAARFTAEGHDHEAYRWIDPATGTSAYYDENGRSLKRFFLRTPLLFAPRVTSGFSTSRLHPVYRTYRPHLGIDYAAPTGSQVVAVANGTVVSAGWSGGGGNMIRLRHANGYETYYLHLSSIGRSVRAGAHVRQGQVIGRVGATGVATGPHLDYRLRKNGVFVNPLAEHRKLPPGEPISPRALPDFRHARDGARQTLSTSLVANAAERKPDAVKAVQ